MQSQSGEVAATQGIEVPTKGRANGRYGHWQSKNEKNATE
jgi:hypothetical protein